MTTTLRRGNQELQPSHRIVGPSITCCPKFTLTGFAAVAAAACPNGR